MYLKVTQKFAQHRYLALQGGLGNGWWPLIGLYWSWRACDSPTEHVTSHPSSMTPLGKMVAWLCFRASGLFAAIKGLTDSQLDGRCLGIQCEYLSYFSLFLCVCMFMYVYLCGGVYTVSVHVCREARNQLWVSSSMMLCAIFWNRVSPWSWSSLIHQSG